MSRTSALILTVLAVGLTGAPAKGEWYGPDYRSCAGDSTVEIVACLTDETAYWDDRLNEAYRQLMARLTPPRQDRLRAAQRLWIRYRDANCGFYAAGEGTIARIEAAECLRTMTQLRFEELERTADPEGSRD